MDDGSRVAVVSYAYRQPTKHAQKGWIQKPDAPIIWNAVAFDQGITDLPLGPKELTARHLRRIDRVKPIEAWIDGEMQQVVPSEWFYRPAPNLAPKWWDELVGWLARQRVAYHNAKFDMQQIRAGLRGCGEGDALPAAGSRRARAGHGLGVDLESSFYWDTQLGQYILEPGESTGLKPTAERLHLGRSVGIESGAEANEQRALAPWRGPMSGKDSDPRYDLIPWQVMKPYAATDALLTLLLLERQLRVLTEAYQTWATHIDRQFDLMIALYRMENRGIGFDVDGCLVERDKLEQIKAEQAELLPFRPTPDQARYHFFNGPKDTPPGLGVIPRSDKMTDGGKPQVDEEVITALTKHGSPAVADAAKVYQRHEAVKSAVSKWYGAWPRFTGADGRLRTSYRQAKVVSGRLSAERVQLQAIPREYQLAELGDDIRNIREFFVPRLGYRHWELDLANAEPRIATVVARCQPMYNAVVVDKQDTHSAATLLMFSGVMAPDPGGQVFGPGHQDWDEYRQVGKRAQPLDEPVATPVGWRPIGDLQPGDLVLGRNGDPIKVEAIAYEGNDEVWEVTTRTGRVVRCCGDHAWTVQKASGVERTIATRWLTDADYLPMPDPMRFDPVELPLDPYTLGALLGDGSWRSNPKLYANIEDGREIAARIAAGTGDTIHVAPYAANPGAARFALRGGNVRRGLVEIGLTPQPTMRDKRVPEAYLRGSIHQRYALLRGLMDTDGCISADGKSTFTSTSEGLVDAVAELVRSLGGSATISSEWRPSDRSWSPAWRASIRTPECPFALQRKVDRWRPPKHLRDRIVSARPTRQVVAQRCITVAADDGIYLTRGYVPTHNCNLGILYAAGPGVIREQIRHFTGVEYDLNQVKVWVDLYRRTFPEYVAATEWWANYVDQFGFVRTVTNRIRAYAQYEPYHSAFNQVIQGSVADAIGIAMVDVEVRVPDAMLLQVHDSLILELPDTAAGIEQLALVALIMRVTFERLFALRWRKAEPRRFMPFPVDAKPFGRIGPDDDAKLLQTAAEAAIAERYQRYLDSRAGRFALEAMAS